MIFKRIFLKTGGAKIDWKFSWKWTDRIDLFLSLGFEAQNNNFQLNARN